MGPLARRPDSGAVYDHVKPPVRIYGFSYHGVGVIGDRDITGVPDGLAAVGLAYLGLGIYLVLVDVLNLEALEPVSTIDDDVIYDHVELAVLVIILAVVIAPITEEIFYRGFMFGGFAKRWGVPPAALLSGLIFAVAHIDVGSIIPFTIIGVVFALVYYRSRNLFSAWGAHVLFNAIAIVGTIADRGVG